MLRSASLPAFRAILFQMETPSCCHPQENPCVAGSSLDVELQLIRCYLHFFSRWKTRDLLTAYGKHLPENCTAGLGWEAFKKQDKEQIPQSLLHLKNRLCLQVKMRFMLPACSCHDHLLITRSHHLMEYDWQPPLQKELQLE